MKVKTNELIGIALDWVVAICEGYSSDTYLRSAYIKVDTNNKPLGIQIPKDHEYIWFNPSTNWAIAGLIIEREIGNLWKHNKLDINVPDVWTAAIYRKTTDSIKAYHEDGPTPLIAAMRCLVHSKLGNEVEIPDALRCTVGGPLYP